MKHFILFLLIATSTYAQKHKLPEIHFTSPDGKTSGYYKKLGIKDKNTLIVSAGSTRSLYNGVENFLVYSKNTAVRKFKLNHKSNSCQEIEVSPEQSEKYWQFLYNCFTADIKQINRYQLIDIEHKIVVLDGSTDYFSVYQNKQSFDLSSYSSHTYIDAKSKGWEQRQKLLDLIQKFEDNFNQ